MGYVKLITWQTNLSLWLWSEVASGISKSNTVQNDIYDKLGRAAYIILLLL